jgi:hypothetical protein
VLAVTELLRGVHDLVEDWLQSFRTRDCAKNVSDCPPLLAQALVVAQERLDVACLVLLHPASAQAVTSDASRSMPSSI